MPLFSLPADKSLLNVEAEEKAAAAVAPTEKVCPYCCSKIPVDAVRCPHCTSELKGKK